MDISSAHQTARATACRLAALTASWELLTASGPGLVMVEIYDDPRPGGPGQDPGRDPLAVLPLADPAELVAEELAIDLPTPLEGLALAGGVAAWARILDRSGQWWAEMPVSAEADPAPGLVLDDTQLYSGGLVSLTTARIHG